VNLSPIEEPVRLGPQIRWRVTGAPSRAEVIGRAAMLPETPVQFGFMMALQ
jgi:hypothetical protein